ncbi:MAG: ribosome silencing factor [Pseudomonadota bacterium]
MSAKGRAILATILKALEDGKAEDIVTIDLIGKTSLADAMVIASGRSQRQVAALAGQVVEKLKASSALVPKVEGKTSGDWVLIDAGDIIVHVFRPEVRSFYNLEKMWAIDVVEPLAQA